ncbi:MAG: hypothetical protein AB1414_18955, partial [bacterium]
HFSISHLVPLLFQYRLSKNPSLYKSAKGNIILSYFSDRLLVDGIGSPGLPFMIEAVKDKKRHWMCRIIVLEVIPGLGDSIIREDGTFKSVDDRIIKLLMELIVSMAIEN